MAEEENELHDQGWQESLSTEETASDDVIDSQSVISDAISQLSNRSFKRQDVKKLLGTIQRLKNENLSLRDALESTNMLDLATLKNKLRGSNADLVRLRQTNAELRERIQTLEKKIFELVTANKSKVDSASIDNSNQTADSKSISIKSVKEKLKFLNRSKLLSQEDNKPTSAVVNAADGNEQNSSIPRKAIGNPIESIESSSDISAIPPFVRPAPGANTILYSEYLIVFNRSRHFERLTKSLERRLEILQDESSKRNQAVAGAIQTRNIEFAEAKTSETPNDQSSIPKDTNATNVEPISRESRDTKTIRELAAEVKRLTGLLSRQMIEENESVSMKSSQLSDIDNNNLPSESRKVIQEGGTSTKSSSSSDELARPVIMTKPGYSLLFTIAAFLVGILIVLIPLTIRHPEVSLW